MGEPARYFSPRRIALRLNQMRNVVKDYDITAVDIRRQSRAADQQRPFAGFAHELDLLFP